VDIVGKVVVNRRTAFSVIRPAAFLANDFNTGAAGSSGGFRQQEDIEMRKTELRNIAKRTPPAAATAALVLAFALVTAGCREDAAEGVFGETLTLTGQVWTFNGWGDRAAEFTGTRTLASTPPGGTGGIVGGRLEFTVGRPAAGDLQSVVELILMFEEAGWERVTASPTTARAAVLELETPFGILEREHESESETATASRRERAGIFYIFVDQNVTFGSAGANEEGDGWNWTAEPFEISLREGWNALHFRIEETETRTGVTEIYRLFHAEPEYVKWVLREWDETGIGAAPTPPAGAPVGAPVLGAGAFGPTLNLSYQVFTGWGFTGTRSVISHPSGGTGGITNGRLNFTIGRPAAWYLGSIMDLVMELENEGWNQVSANPATARFVFLELETPNGNLWREEESAWETPTVSAWAESLVSYVFVDRDVTISSPGWTETEHWHGDVFRDTFEGFNITLREGWNTLHLMFMEMETDTGESFVASLHHADPYDVRWQLSEW